MNYNKGIQGAEYNEVSELLAQLLDFDSDTEKQVGSYIRTFGIHHFFDNLEGFPLAPDNLRKLQDLKLLLKSINSETDGNE